MLMSLAHIATHSPQEGTVTVVKRLIKYESVLVRLVVLGFFFVCLFVLRYGFSE